MAEYVRGNGISIRVPENLEVSGPATGPGKRKLEMSSRPVPLPASRSDITTIILGSLAERDVKLADKAEINPAPKRPADRRFVEPIPSLQQAEIQVDVAADESSVVLVEQDGIYKWVLPRGKALLQTSKGGQLESAQRSLTFEVPIHAFPPPNKRGIVTDIVRSALTTYVLKFAAGLAISELVKQMEKKVQTGIVQICAPDLSKWQNISDLASIKVPEGRAAKIVLFVHGTFSSTVGSFGALSATPWGAELLKALISNYDAVIGFDHKTLSVDPKQNATELSRILNARDWPQPPRVDVIAFSRGGLVYRSLVEYLVSSGPQNVKFERAIFVACANSGTLMAEPENWTSCIETYTNLAAGACRLLQTLPNAAPAAIILREVIHGVAEFVKCLATNALEDNHVPGISAMRPKGAFITEINKTQSGQITPADARYFAITAEFEPKILGDGAQPPELPRRLLMAIADGAVDRMMGEASDMVVNKSSMTAIDPEVGGFFKDVFDFGVTPRVYHTVYFAQPEVANAIARWLTLQPATAEPPREAARPPSRPVPAPARIEVPAVVDTDIAIVHAEDSVGETVKRIRKTSPSYVVVHRELPGKSFHYAVPAEQILSSATSSGAAIKIGRLLDLHEYQASQEMTVAAAAPKQAVTGLGGMGSASRGVVLEGGKAIGVVPSMADLTRATDLRELAKAAARPSAPEHRVIARRAMPTFAPRITAAAKPPSRPIGGATGRVVSAPSRAAAGAAAAPAPVPAVPPPSVICHFRAEIDAQVLVNRTTSVEVQISREPIESAARAMAVDEKAVVQVGRKLIIQVISKALFTVSGTDREEIDVPELGKPAHLLFDVSATSVGHGEIWVIARQGQVSLLTMVLKPEAVADRTGTPRRYATDGTAAEAAPLIEPLHELRIMEQTFPSETKYQYDFESPILNIFSSYFSAPIVGDRQKYINDIYKDIETRWTSTQGDLDDFTAELKAIGGDLFNQLIPQPLQQVLWNNRAKLKSIMVASSEPFIPWELLYVREPGKPVTDEGMFLGQMGLVRWLYNALYPPTQLRVRDGQVKTCIPDYPHPDYALPEAAKERTFLQGEFKANSVEPHNKAIRELISGPGKFDALHFACHGAAQTDDIADAQLLLQGRIENNQYIPELFSAVTAKAYCNFLPEAGDRPMVVLNACQSGRAGYKLSGIGGFADAFISGGAGAFVGSLWSVDDKIACKFTTAFYLAMKDGLTISEAAVKAREDAKSGGDATWLAYVVYGHPHARMIRN